jgi:polyhydroxybutyrate depolymerase
MFWSKNQAYILFTVALLLFQCTSSAPASLELHEVYEDLRNLEDAQSGAAEVREATNDSEEEQQEEGSLYFDQITLDPQNHADNEDTFGEAGVSELPSVIGGDRPARVVLPKNYTSERAWPLLVLLHGYGINGSLEDLYLGVSARVDSLGFIEVIPEGTVDIYGHQFWNSAPSGSGFAQVDDVAYLRALIEEAKNTYHVDHTRIVLLGHSNGAFMAYRMACEASDIVTAIGALAGSVFGGIETCTPSGAVSVLDMHGTSDTVVPYQG